MHLLLSPLSFHSTVAHFTSSNKPFCHDDERSALLQFKESLLINNSFHYADQCRPKSASWKPEEGNIDCCSWDGVECNEKTGHVIKLDLFNSCLYGSINSSNSLFHLVHLEWLNLDYNNFNFSQIPSAIISLAELSYLNLSSSFFSGQIPSEIQELSNLVSLDLSRNSDFHPFHLGLQKPSLRSLLDKLSNLKKLDLGDVRIASSIPENLVNVSNSLTFLSLQGCQLQGKIPSSLGNLTKLVHLDLSFNNLSDKLPASIGNLASLEELDLSNNKLSSELPSSIGNLGSLEDLDLKFNGFSGELPSTIANLTQLRWLSVGFNKFFGEFPASIGNIKSLELLDASVCNFSGQIPSSLANLTQLRSLDLCENNFSGTMDLNMFLVKLNNLQKLYLSSNKLSLLTKATVNTSSQKFVLVGLSSCNITEFPSFLKNQHQMLGLDLSSNKIVGKVPRWFLSTQILNYLNLSHNLLTGFDDQHPIFLSGSTAVSFTLDLRSNNLQGPLPVPPAKTVDYLVSKNNLTGEIPAWICKLNSLLTLDLSYNNLSGELPKCLGNFSDQLSMLQLRSNQFSGSIPQTFMNGSHLKMIDLSNNLLRGRIPRSLANCRMLEFLNLGKNKISDTFPSWLGTLPDLGVLILRSNRLHGIIRKSEAGCEFPTLRIIDLSNNRFRGKLPSKCFECWNAMKVVNKSQLTYMQDVIAPSISASIDPLDIYVYSLTMSNKGVIMAYEKIPNILVAIILSSNKFNGEIPASIANLRELQILSLSSNNLQGHIPSCLSHLTNLESLDLSNNKLSGKIPQELIDLTFLVFFNVSHNILTGLIPQGNQFTILENSSFDGNLGLCGKPLSKKCENDSKMAENDEDIQGSDSPFTFDWTVVLIGFSGGLVVGVILGLNFSTRIQEWFVEKLGRQSKRTRRKKRSGN